jgi:hypothetical protein
MLVVQSTSNRLLLLAISDRGPTNFKALLNSETAAFQPPILPSIPVNHLPCGTKNIIWSFCRCRQGWQLTLCHLQTLSLWPPRHKHRLDPSAQPKMDKFKEMIRKLGHL